MKEPSREVKPGSLWVQDQYPHFQCYIGNLRMTAYTGLGHERILYHLKPRFPGKANDSMYITEGDLRHSWWSVDEWPKE